MHLSPFHPLLFPRPQKQPPAQSSVLRLNSACIAFKCEFTHYSKSGFPSPASYLSRLLWMSRLMWRTDTLPCQSTDGLRLTTVHTRQLRTKMCAEQRIQTNRNGNTHNTHTHACAHTHRHTHYHCIAGITPRPGCVQVWSLSPCLRGMLISGGGCQLSHICLYLCCSHSSCLSVSPPLSAPFLSNLKRRFSSSTSLRLSPFAPLPPFSHKLSSHHSKSCLSFLLLHFDALLPPSLPPRG